MRNVSPRMNLRTIAMATAQETFKGGEVRFLSVDALERCDCQSARR